MSDKKKIVVHFYKNINSKEPVREWLLSLDKEDCKSIGVDIKKVEFGWPLGMPICKAIGRGLYEVRSNLKDKKIARILFCIEDGFMILLHAFVKKTQQIEKREIEIALKRMKEVLNEKN